MILIQRGLKKDKMRMKNYWDNGLDDSEGLHTLNKIIKDELVIGKTRKINNKIQSTSLDLFRGKRRLSLQIINVDI